MNFFIKLKKCVSTMNEMPKKIVKYGASLAIGICLIGFITYIINSRMSIFNYLGEQFGTHIIFAGMGLLVQFVIGGLVADIILKRRGA